MNSDNEGREPEDNSSKTIPTSECVEYVKQSAALSELSRSLRSLKRDYKKQKKHVRRMGKSIFQRLDAGHRIEDEGKKVLDQINDREEEENSNGTE